MGTMKAVAPEASTHNVGSGLNRIPEEGSKNLEPRKRYAHFVAFKDIRFEFETLFPLRMTQIIILELKRINDACKRFLS